MINAKLQLADFAYAVPPELIAQQPAPRRDESRLLVIPRGGPIEHRRFTDIAELLRPGDLLVRNNAKVLPARLIGRRAGGGRAELLLLRPEAGPGVRWRALAKPGKALRPGIGLEFGSLAARVEAKLPDGEVVVAFSVAAADFPQLLEREGRMPLPPYVRRNERTDPATLAADAERYQTIYARVPGAVAAPTAGLHFTDDTFAAIAKKGIAVADLTLLVGAGTFLPIRTDDLDAHVMHAEWFDLPPATGAAIDACRTRGGRVVAVGTTAARVLETLGGADGRAPAGRGETRLFIKPGHRWRVVDALVTNFHLPKSTLLVLVCALAGTDRMLAAYREAVAERYRFFSYGDACWIERGEQ
jgi:S-adenosylmethionine:tRNA ribosyltransferase-isomerase